MEFLESSANGLNGIVDTLRNQISSEGFWQGTLAAIILAVLGTLGKRGWHVVREWLQGDKGFAISGYWIGECNLPSYSHPQLEIWHYSITRQRVSLIFFAYSGEGNPPQRPTRWHGGGVCRGPNLACHYYLTSRGGSESYEAGVIALQLRAMALEGVYAQFDPKHPDDPLFVSDSAPVARYLQRRIELPLPARVRMVLGRPPLRTYAEVNRLHNDAMIRRPQRSVPLVEATAQSAAGSTPRRGSAVNQHGQENGSFAKRAQDTEEVDRPSGD